MRLLFKVECEGDPNDGQLHFTIENMSEYTKDPGALGIILADLMRGMGSCYEPNALPRIVEVMAAELATPREIQFKDEHQKL